MCVYNFAINYLFGNLAFTLPPSYGDRIPEIGTLLSIVSLLSCLDLVLNCRFHIPVKESVKHTPQDMERGHLVSIFSTALRRNTGYFLAPYAGLTIQFMSADAVKKN